VFPPWLNQAQEVHRDVKHLGKAVPESFGVYNTNHWVSKIHTASKAVTKPTRDN
jgi:hypothetical protein